MSFLVDTSVWIDHFRFGNGRLEELLREDAVLMHAAILGELACGHLRRRAEILDALRLLPRAQEASGDEVLAFIEQHRLYGKGIGWTDAHLLSSSALSGAKIWTLDRALAKLT